MNFQHGTKGDDTLIGLLNDNNELRGWSGGDVLVGGKQDDLLVGGKGGDFLWGRKG